MAKMDLDALLAEPLELRLGGKDFVISELSTRTVLELDSARQERPDDAWHILRLVLGPLGLTDEELGNLDHRKALAAVALISDHFTGLPEKAKEAHPALRLISQRLTGALPSVPSSGSIQDTGSGTP